MNPFCIDDKFFTDIEDFLIDREMDEDDIKALPEDWEQEVEETQLEQMFQFKEEYIADAVMDSIEGRWEERFPEDPDDVDKKIKKAIIQGVDITKINSLIPSLWYPNGKKSKLTKADLLSAV